MVMLAMSAGIPGLAPRDGTASPWQSAVFYVSLYVVALGTGGIIVDAQFLVIHVFPGFPTQTSQTYC